VGNIASYHKFGLNFYYESDIFAVPYVSVLEDPTLIDLQLQAIKTQIWEFMRSSAEVTTALTVLDTGTGFN